MRTQEDVVDDCTETSRGPNRREAAAIISRLGLGPNWDALAQMLPRNQFNRSRNSLEIEPVHRRPSRQLKRLAELVWCGMAASSVPESATYELAKFRSYKDNQNERLLLCEAR